MADVQPSTTGSPEAGPSKTPLVTFKKAKSRPSALTKRKRSPSPSSAAASDEPISSSVIRAKHAAPANPLVQGTKRLREEKERERLQDRANELAALEYRADERGLGDVGERTLATRSSDWDLDKDEGKKGGGETIKRARMDEDGNLLPDDGLYHGSGGYTNFIKPDPNLNRSSKTRAGPIKATSNIRTITVVDYQPDVCKDYKGTSCRRPFATTCADPIIRHRDRLLRLRRLVQVSARPRRLSCRMAARQARCQPCDGQPRAPGERGRGRPVCVPHLPQPVQGPGGHQVRALL